MFFSPEIYMITKLNFLLIFFRTCHNISSCNSRNQERDSLCNKITMQRNSTSHKNACTVVYVLFKPANITTLQRIFLDSSLIYKPLNYSRIIFDGKTILDWYPTIFSKHFSVMVEIMFTFVAKKFLFCIFDERLDWLHYI